MRDCERDALKQMGYHNAFVKYRTKNNELLIQAVGPNGVVRGWLRDFMSVEDIEWVRPNGIRWPKDVVPKREKRVYWYEKGRKRYDVT